MKGTKFCTKCGDEKSLEDFKCSKKSRDGRFSQCKDCERKYREARSNEHREYMRTYYASNRPRLAAYMASYHQDHKNERNSYTKTYYRARRMNNLEADILTRCRYRAKKHGIPFDLTIEDIIIPERCPVLGIPLDRGGVGTKGGRPNSPSLDRMRPAGGYVKANVRVISNRANTLKCDATIAELEAVLADLHRLNPRP